jgi:cell volume regulation protein A
MGVDMDILEIEKSEMREVVIQPSSNVVGKKVVVLGIPKAAHIVTIKRKDKYFVPVGSTTLLTEDKLLILAQDKKTMQDVYSILGVKEDV